jgi:tetratricopeptide (TPR) repeat protein
LGRYYWFAGDYEKSREYFQKAIDLAPDYAAAWSGLADSHTGSVATGSVSPTQSCREPRWPQGRHWN